MSDQVEVGVSALDDLSKSYRNNAQRCEEVASFLASEKGRLFWESQAATTFKGKMDDYIRLLRQFKADFTQLSSELQRRADIRRGTQGG